MKFWLAGDADAVAWMKANTDVVDRMLADAVFGATVTALSEVTGFSPEQVRDMSGNGLFLYPAGVDPEAPKSRQERYRLRLKRYFFPGRDVRDADTGKVRRVRYDPMLVVERDLQLYDMKQTRIGMKVGPTGKFTPEWAMRPAWMNTTRSWWLGPDGTWNTGTPARVVEVKRADGSTYTYDVRGEQLEGHVHVDIACDERCVSATGRKCECACGGANHGAGAQEVVVPFTGAELLAIALRR